MATTNWREIGDTTIEAFRAAVKGTPLAAEADAIYAVAKPNTRLLIAQAKVESELGASSLAKNAHNFLGQRPRPDDKAGATISTGSGVFRSFVTFADCARYWIGKITDPTYAYAAVFAAEAALFVLAAIIALRIEHAPPRPRGDVLRNPLTAAARFQLPELEAR